MYRAIAAGPIALFAALCGVGDALHFVHASKVWKQGRFVRSEAFACFAAFQSGLLV